MRCLYLIWPHLKVLLEATYVTIEIAVVGAIIAWLQLDYAKKRDKRLDERDAWTEIHKAMTEFRFRREMLNTPPPLRDTNAAVMDAALEASLAMHKLRGQLNRVNHPLVNEIEHYLQRNLLAEQWRADAFVPKFDEYTHEAARRSW